MGLWTNIPLDFRKCNRLHHGELKVLVSDKGKRAIIPKGLTNMIYEITKF